MLEVLAIRRKFFQCPPSFPSACQSLQFLNSCFSKAYLLLSMKQRSHLSHLSPCHALLFDDASSVWSRINVSLVSSSHGTSKNDRQDTKSISSGSPSCPQWRHCVFSQRRLPEIFGPCTMTHRCSQHMATRHSLMWPIAAALAMFASNCRFTWCQW